jgi:hypothetical protein
MFLESSPYIHTQNQKGQVGKQILEKGHLLNLMGTIKVTSAT